MEDLEDKPIDGKYLSKSELESRLIKMGVKFDEHILVSKMDYAMVYNKHVFDPNFNKHIIQILANDAVNKEKILGTTGKKKYEEFAKNLGKKRKHINEENVKEKKILDVLFSNSKNLDLNEPTNSKIVESKKEHNINNINQIIEKVLDSNEKSTHSEKKAVKDFLINLAANNKNLINENQKNVDHPQKLVIPNNFTLGKSSGQKQFVEPQQKSNSNKNLSKILIDEKKDDAKSKSHSDLKNHLNRTANNYEDQSLYKRLGIDKINMKEESSFHNYTPQYDKSSNRLKTNSRIHLKKSFENLDKENFMESCSICELSKDFKLFGIRGLSPLFLLKSGFTILFLGSVCYVLSNQEIRNKLKEIFKNLLIGLNIDYNLVNLRYFLILCLVFSIFYIIYSSYRRNKSLYIASEHYNQLLVLSHRKEDYPTEQDFCVSEELLVSTLAEKCEMTVNAYKYDIYPLLKEIIVEDDYFYTDYINKEKFIRLIPGARQTYEKKESSFFFN